ncbi:MAG: uracil-DNA glycosylase family protein [Bacteroidota bacterium]
MSFAKNILKFYRDVTIPTGLPKGVEVLYPFDDPNVLDILDTFYEKYFNDDQRRIFLIGINPGRFGAGVTGIPFTDPIRLKEVLDIENDFDKKAELSSKFIYQMIEALGGAKRFYQHFFFSSVSPLGFVKDGKNLNYYDQADLMQALETYMMTNMQKKVAFGGVKQIAFALGQGQNYKQLLKYNKQYRLFDEIKPLPHPRWVMQYRLKRLDEFIEMYVKELEEAIANTSF